MLNNASTVGIGMDWARFIYLFSNTPTQLLAIGE